VWPIGGDGVSVMSGPQERNMRDLYNRTRHKDFPALEVRRAASTTVLWRTRCCWGLVVVVSFPNRMRCAVLGVRGFEGLQTTHAGVLMIQVSLCFLRIHDFTRRRIEIHRIYTPVSV
jgi:hypothetical protein